MLPCLSHLTYTKKTYYANNENNKNNKNNKINKNSKNNKHNKTNQCDKNKNDDIIFQHQSSCSSSSSSSITMAMTTCALNVHTIAQFDFILFQQVF